MTVTPRLFALLALMSAAPALAGAPPKPTRLQVFKNGYAVVRYDLKPQADTFTLLLPGRTRHGSVWFTCPKDPSCVISIDSSKEEFSRPPLIESVKQLLKPGAGNVQLVVDSDGRTVEGVVAAVYTSGGETDAAPLVVVLKTANNRTVAVDAGSIREVRFDTAPTLPQQTPSPDFDDRLQPLTVALKPGSAAAGVTLTTVEWGYTWAPSYLLDLTSEDKAHLQMKATLFNEGLPLENALVELAAGWPNLAFSGQRDALHTATSLSDYLRDIENTGGYSNRRENVTAQRMTNAYAASDFDNDDRSYATPGASASSREDLHLYYGKAVNLKPGARFSATVFAETLKKEHVFEWNVPDLSDRGAEDAAPRFLTHKIKLTNSAAAPLTTGPVAILQQGAMVAQSTLNYTPAGAVSEIEVSRALDFALKANDNVNMEAARDVTVAGRSRLRVPGKGVLSVKNLKNRAVKVVVKKTVQARVENVSSGGKATEVSSSYAYDNPTTTVVWEKELKPGELWALGYDFFKLQN